MLRMAISAVLLLALTVAPQVKAAGLEGPRGKWWNRPQVVEKLNLTQEEVGHLDAAYLESRRALIRMKGDLQLEQLELESLMEGSEFNEAAVMSQFNKVEVARQYLAVERFRFLVEVRMLLGQHRYLELKRSFKKFRKERRGEREKLSRLAPSSRQQLRAQRGLDLRPGNL